MSTLTIDAEIAELPTPRRTLVSIDTIDLTTVNERLFIPVADQLANIRRWNAERNWGFTEADFEAVDTTPVVHEKPFVVDVVAVWLPDDDGVDGIRRTFEELWAAASEGVPENWSWRQHLGGPRPVKLLPGMKHVPGIRRVTLDLAAGWDPIDGARAIEIRGRQSASAEILAAAAHFPGVGPGHGGHAGALRVPRRLRGVPPRERGLAPRPVPQLERVPGPGQPHGPLGRPHPAPLGGPRGVDPGRISPSATIG